MEKYSIGINGLRGICAIIIALFHFELYFPFGKIKVFSSGYIAVEFFFLLSGFLICKSFFEKNSQDIPNVIASKVKKMYPAYNNIIFNIKLWYCYSILFNIKKIGTIFKEIA